MQPQWLDEVKFNADGLVTVVAQDKESGRVLMLAWADREALEETVRTGRGVYFSRSRQKLWRKGEESGNVQIVHEVRLDCDGDAAFTADLKTAPGASRTTSSSIRRSYTLIISAKRAAHADAFGLQHAGHFRTLAVLGRQHACPVRRRG